MTRRREWRCDGCGEPIADRDGWLHADAQAANRGEFTRWQAHHAACDPDPEAWTYAIDVEAIRTESDVAFWDRHMSAKGWLRNTDWVRRTGVARGVVVPLR